MTALEDRRQTAREAGLDEVGYTQDLDMAHALEAAIETATRVRITDDMVLRADDAQDRAAGNHLDQMRAALGNAFEAAGFEVES